MYPWVLLVAALLVIWLLFTRAPVENFVTVDLNTATAQRQQLQFEGEGRYNDFARLQSTNTTLNPDQVDAALQQAIPMATSGSDSLLSLLGSVNLGAAARPGGGIQGSPEQTGAVQQKINFCESMTTVNCDLLDDPRLAECGFCHRDGVSSRGAAHRGGMYISSDDQIRANQVSNANDEAAAVYRPTVGTCAPRNFTLMKDNCVSRERHMECQRAGAATSQNQCGQCFGAAPAGTTGLIFMGPKPRPYAAILHVSHPGSNGDFIVRYANGSQVVIPRSTGRSFFEPQQIPLVLTEGDRITIVISGIPTIWCAWLSSEDGMRSVGLNVGIDTMAPAGGMVVLGDKRSQNVIARAPRDAAFQAFLERMPNNVLWYRRVDALLSPVVGNATWNFPTVDVTRRVLDLIAENRDIRVTRDELQIPNSNQSSTRNVLQISLDNGRRVVNENDTIPRSAFQSVLTLNIVVPATLADPFYADDREDCPSGPLVLTQEGAGRMSANSCFRMDGSFNPSAFCIQKLWIGAGATERGRLYPRTNAEAAALARPTLDETMAAFNAGVNVAMYGTNPGGGPADRDLIAKNSLDYFGIVINNPCDGPRAETGPHSPECLDYLWRTSGDASRDGVRMDTTTLPYAFCGVEGQAAPLNANGSVNQGNVTNANAKGAVPNVRAYFQGMFNRSRDPSDFNTQLAAMRSCYNVDIQPTQRDSATCPPKNPDEWQCVGRKQLGHSIWRGAPPAGSSEDSTIPVKMVGNSVFCGSGNGRVCDYVYPDEALCENSNRPPATAVPMSAGYAQPAIIDTGRLEASIKQYLSGRV